MSEFNNANDFEGSVFVKEEKEDTVIEKSKLETGNESIGISEMKFDAERVDAVETIGGSATRRYLNEKVTKKLLEGMRMIAREKPEDPLRVLGQFLIDASEKN